MRHALTRCALLAGVALGGCAPPPTDADDFNAEQDAGDDPVPMVNESPSAR